MKRWLCRAAALLVLLAWGCGAPAEGLTGEYESDGGGLAPARLTLRSDGGGALTVGGEEAPFRWEGRGEGQVLLHTRQGGALLARRASSGALELDMPGAGKLSFHKKGK